MKPKKFYLSVVDHTEKIAGAIEEVVEEFYRKGIINVRISWERRAITIDNQLHYFRTAKQLCHVEGSKFFNGRKFEEINGIGEIGLIDYEMYLLAKNSLTEAPFKKKGLKTHYPGEEQNKVLCGHYNELGDSLNVTKNCQDVDCKSCLELLDRKAGGVSCEC